MVKSKLNDKINYEEKQAIEEEDKELETSLYSILYHEIKCVIALGSVKKTHDRYGVLYVPIYLALLPSEKTIQIGVYEFKSSRLLSLTDSDGDLHLAFMGEPLLYGFVDQGFLKEKLSDQYDNEIWNSLNDEPEEEYIIGDEIAGKPFVKMYENDEIENLENKQPGPYNSMKSSNWVQSFLKNNRYKFIRVPGDGDCLFTTIKLGYESIGINLPVAKMREMVSNDTNQEQFDSYNEFYTLYKNEVETTTNTIIKLKNQFDIIKGKLKKLKGKDTEQYNKNREIAKEIKAKYTESKKDLDNANDNLSDLDWFKDIKSLSDLKEHIKKSTFWADETAITKLEYLINTKIIILSKDNQTISCGFVDERITKEGNYNPMYYIIVSHHKEGGHYDLIGYQYPDDVRKIFRYHELPFDLKSKIKETCMEKGDTVYTFIPLFNKILRNKENEDSDVNETTQAQNIEFEDSAEVSEENNKSEPKENIDESDDSGVVGYKFLDDNNKDNLYDDNVVFQFYSKSNKKPYPGKGSGETISDDRKNDFDELSKITDWRKMLSNMYISPFELDGLQWNSVEHYYHANKFKNNPEFYKQFSLNSKSIISTDPLKAKTAGGPTGKVDGKKFRPNDVRMDEEFIKNKRSITMEKAQKAKYTQNEELKKMLLATKDAKLVHKVRNTVEIFYETMNVRENLKKMEN